MVQDGHFSIGPQKHREAKDWVGEFGWPLIVWAWKPRFESEAEASLAAAVTGY